MENKETVRRESKIAIDICKDKLETRFFLKGHYGSYDKIYRMCNEDLTGFLPQLIKKDGSVLTVASSGDQYLSSVLFDAKEIDIFDVNKFTYYFTYLKIAAIKTLEFDEYKEIFLYRPASPQHVPFNNKVLKKLKPYLEADVYEFFHTICMNGIRVLERLFFMYSFIEQEAAVTDIPYLKEKKYYQLKDKLNNRELPTFIHGEVTDVIKNSSKTYDTILLSNMAIYTMTLPDWITFIDTEVMKKLNNDGAVQADYYWEYDNKVAFEYREAGFTVRGINPAHDDTFVYKRRCK